MDPAEWEEFSAFMAAEGQIGGEIPPDEVATNELLPD
jgi:hypothetical protein